MKKNISLEAESEINNLGIYQIIGGGIGALIVFRTLFKTPLLTGLNALLFVLALILFAFSIFCGILCLTSNKNSLKYSLANQMLQLVGFAVLGFAFQYVAGVYLMIGIDLTHEIKFDFNIGFSTVYFHLNTEKEQIEINVNLIAFALVYWIDKKIRKLKDDASVRQF